MSFVSARRWAAALSVVAVAATPAAAQQVSFSALTSGCFFATTTPGTCSASPLSFANGALSFSGAAFSGTTVAGVASGLNLGTFTLSGAGPMGFDTPTNWYFRLTTVFTSPTVISGGPSTSFQADLVGALNARSNGSVVVTWSGPTSQAFTYSNATEQGGFTYGLTDLNGGTQGLNNPAGLNVQGGTTQDVTGDISSAFSSAAEQDIGLAVVATPEPATAGLVALGLFGIAAVRRRRKA